MEMTGVLCNDILGVALEALLPHFSDFISVAKYIKERDKKKKDVFKIISRAKTTGALSDKMYDLLQDASNDNPIVEFDLISTAVKTNNWINYALWHMVEDDSVLLKVSDDAKKLVNAVGVLAGFGPIYQSAGMVDLNIYAIENEDRVPGTKFILSIEDLKKKVFDQKFRDAMNLRKAKLMSAASRMIPQGNNYFGSFGTLDQDGMIHPVFFSSRPLITDIGPKQGDLSDELFDRLEGALSGMIMDEKYAYSTDIGTGLPILTIMRDGSFGATETFLLDDGRVMGGMDISILGTYMTQNGTVDHIFVDVKKFPAIAYNIINRSFYQLTQEDVSRAFSSMLQYYPIYNFIDFTDTAWYDYLNDGEKATLTKHLTDIYGFMKADPHMYYLPRLRFSSYTNPDNFTLVSDNLVRSPMKDIGFTSPEICDGLSFVCLEGQLTQYFSSMANATFIGDV